MDQNLQLLVLTFLSGEIQFLSKHADVFGRLFVPHLKILHCSMSLLAVAIFAFDLCVSRHSARIAVVADHAHYQPRQWPPESLSLGTENGAPREGVLTCDYSRLSLMPTRHAALLI